MTISGNQVGTQIYYNATMPFNFYCAGGDGAQVARTNTVGIPLLAAGVANGNAALSGTVRFTIVDGDISIMDPSQGITVSGSGNHIDVPSGNYSTETPGIAEILLTPIAGGRSSTSVVKAELLFVGTNSPKIVPTNLAPIYYKNSIIDQIPAATTGRLQLSGFTAGSTSIHLYGPFQHYISGLSDPPAIILGYYPSPNDEYYPNPKLAVSVPIFPVGSGFVGVSVPIAPVSVPIFPVGSGFVGVSVPIAPVSVPIASVGSGFVGVSVPIVPAPVPIASVGRGFVDAFVNLGDEAITIPAKTNGASPQVYNLKAVGVNLKTFMVTIDTDANTKPFELRFWAIPAQAQPDQTGLEQQVSASTPVLSMPTPTPVPTPVLSMPTPTPVPTPVLSMPTPTPVPTPVLSMPTPTPVPTPVLSMPTPTPVPTPVLSMPTPTPVPTPVLSMPTPTPVPTPVLSMPTPTPVPTPVLSMPTPTPVPTPVLSMPTPTPVPTPVLSMPTPTPVPTPVLSMPTPTPVPTPVLSMPTPTPVPTPVLSMPTPTPIGSGFVGVSVPIVPAPVPIAPVGSGAVGGSIKVVPKV